MLTNILIGKIIIMKEDILIIKRLYKNYTKKYYKHILLAIIFSILVAASTSGIAYLLDPAIEKIFINKTAHFYT